MIYAKMKDVLFFLLLGAVWLHPARSDEDCVEGEENCSGRAGGEARHHAEVHNNILILTDDNFSEVVKEEEMMLVTYYAPW